MACHKFSCPGADGLVGNLPGIPPVDAGAGLHPHDFHVEGCRHLRHQNHVQGLRLSVVRLVLLREGRICYRGRPRCCHDRLGLSFHNGVGISTGDTKHEAVLFPSAFERRGYPTAEHLETPDGVDVVVLPLLESSMLAAFRTRSRTLERRAVLHSVSVHFGRTTGGFLCAVAWSS